MSQEGGGSAKSMNVYTPRVGLGNVGSYQVSGYPWITGSANIPAGQEDTIRFPYVTKQIVVVTSGSNAAIRVHFNSTGSDGQVVPNHHFVQLDGDEESFTFNVKCKELFISAVAASGYKIYAELTGIGTASMPTLTGSGLTGGPVTDFGS